MSTLRWLDPDRLEFPPLHLALKDPNGLLAVGGDLSPERLILAYRSGIFPWYEDNQPILWWSPDPRLVLFPEEFRMSRSLRRRLRQNQFEVRIDSAFNQVLEACSGAREDQDGTWITPEMKAAYQRLHLLGYAHSIETWQDDRLVGGLYGVAIGRLFFGESMFHRVTDASKVALAWLCRLMRSHQCPLIDCQVETGHLLSLGARNIPRDDFVRWLNEYCYPPAGPWHDLPSRPGPW